MTFSPGARLGAYEILAVIGAGGMGEVFRARDTTLNREVAIKVLPAALASDSERLARFKREAQVLASLNHPNIAAIYGLEDVGATVALVMELVEGEDRRGPAHRAPDREGAGGRARAPGSRIGSYEIVRRPSAR